MIVRLAVIYLVTLGGGVLALALVYGAARVYDRLGDPEYPVRHG